MMRLWRRLVAFGFRLLYNELAWLYDPVSWIVSLGKWQRWQASIWPYLPPAGRILEIGSGPGHLLVELSASGYQVVGLDLSPAMLRLTRRRLGGQGLTTPVCRGRATALPFAPGRFDAVVLTFPTEFVYDPVCIRQLARALKDGGRLVVAETCRFQRRDLLARFLEWLYRITGQRGAAPDLPARLDEADLAARRERVEVNGSSVTIVLAEKRKSAL
jgi:ubiquinone/menaquinone biosynthesis C-methylase UbiE